MITGNKKDIAKILSYVNPRLQTGLEYIVRTDFSQVANGEYELDGRQVFARINTYTTEPKSARRPEKHHDYIDIQYVARGSEDIYFTPWSADCVETENKEASDDVIFYADPQELNKVTLHAGDFAIFFPWELHRPNCQAEGQAAEVQKIVVKVKAC